MSIENMRKDFEAAVAKEPRLYSLTRSKGGEYYDHEARMVWRIWQAATCAAVPAWQPIDTAPKSEGESFMVLREGVAIQVSCFEGHLYADAKEAVIDWDDAILDATHWQPRAPAPKVST